MVQKKFIIDPAEIDFDNVVADIDAIRQYNPQRFEMEQLTAIVYVDVDRILCVGYRDLAQDEVWVRGHLPGMPIMPGVFMCEAAAQVCSYLIQRYDLLGAELLGFGGMDEVRFRGPVFPGDRLMIACEGTRVRRGRMITCRFQGVVEDRIVVDGTIKGIPLLVRQMVKPSGETAHS